MKVILSTILTAGFLIVSGSALAQTTQKQLTGGWTVVSVINHVDGKDIDVYGKNPAGYMTFGTNGRFSIQLMRPDLPKIASNNRVKTTPEEGAAIAQGLLSYFGTWKLVDAKTGEIAMHIEASSFANWNGTDQKRFMTVKGDTLTVNNPVSPAGGTATVTLKRAK
jgi:hypothetical protein